jgi:hypothetical protein
MADGVQFLLALIDKMSGPAVKIAEALKGVRSELEAVQQLASKPLKIALDASGAAGAVRAARSAGPAPAQGVSRAFAKANSEARGFDNAALIPKIPIEPIRLANGELDVLKQRLRDDKLAVTNLTASMRQLQQASVVNIDAFRLLQSQIAEKKNSLASVQAKLVMSGNAARFGSEGTNRLTTTLRELAEAAGGQGITGLADRLRGFRDNAGVAAGAFEQLTGVGGKAALAVGGIGLAAIAAAAGVYKLATAVGDLVFAGAKLAIEAAEARGDTLDMLDAMLGSAEAARSVYSQITAMTQGLAVSQAGVQASAQALAAAGIENKDQLVAAVRSIAQVDSVIKGAGGKIQSIIERATASGKFEIQARRLTGTGVQIQKLVEEIARRTGKGAKEVEKQLKAGKIAASVGIDALTAVIDKKFGELAKKQALDFPAQLQRLRDNFTKLFDGVDTGPFLEAFSRLVDLFDSGTSSGAAMKEALTATFDGVFRAITAVEPYAKTFLKGLVIIALQVAIAFKPLIKSIREAFGGDQQKGPLDLAKAMSLTGLVLNRLVAWFVAALPEIRAFLVTAEILAHPFIQMAKGVGAVVALLTAFTVAAGIAIVWMVQLGTKATEAGRNVVVGLINGIKSGASQLVDAVTGIAGDALAAFKKKFGIASPSRVMMDMGGHLSAGLALGIRSGAPAANDNMRDMLAVPPPRLRDSQRQSQERASVVFQSGAVAIQISGNNAQQIGAELMPIVADIFEQAAQAS